jgi:hypothetical protein
MKFPIVALLACTLFFSLNAGEKRVELISNFQIDPGYMTDKLKSSGIDTKIIATDLKQYKGIIKNRSRWGKILKKISLDLPHKINVGEDVSKIFFWNLDGNYRHAYCLDKLPKEKLVLFMWEPPCVLPKMYSEKAQELFPKVYTFNDELVDNQKYFKLHYPVLRNMITERPSFEEKKLLTMVVGYSTNTYPNNLYCEREKVIDFFEKIGGDDFDFYGRYWDGSLYKNYKGAPKDKIEAIKNYRFSICYENTRNVRGYITEKIFDCFTAGNVPVYWGAPNIDSYVPKNCYIDRRDFQSEEELLAFLKNMGKEEYEGYILRIQEYLVSEQAQVFSMEHFLNLIVDAVKN